LQFDDKFIEIRPSGTDAKTKAYAAGLNKEELSKISNTYRNLYHAYACRADKEYNNNQIKSVIKHLTN